MLVWISHPEGTVDSLSNRSAHQQRKWNYFFHKVPLAPGASSTATGQSSHSSTSDVSSPPHASSVAPSITPQMPLPDDTSTITSATDVQSPSKRARISLSMFERSRYGGKHVAAAKPNLNLTRKSSQVQVTAEVHKVQSSAPATRPSSDPFPSPDFAHQPPRQRPPACPSSDTFFLAPPLPPSVRSPEPPSPVAEPAVNPFQPEDSATLPLLWPKTIPQQDHKWVSAALFRVGTSGKLELGDNLQLWYYPPQPSLVYNQAPTPSRFFAHALLLWMPYRLWKVRLLCTNPACTQHPLSSGGLHRRARQVLDIDRYYSLVTETLICTKCRTSYLSSGQAILQQLDLAHRSEFRVILTRRYACDVRVIRLLRERGLGNSPARIIGQLKENHSEEWLQRVARYTAECAAFMASRSLLPLHFQEPPEPVALPSYKWLLVVYSQDILNRLEDIKANITSTYGTILKMDSTKKITKRLTGPAKGTAQWLASVGNEVGQVLISVLTASEGPALDVMADGLVNRYQAAGVDPPVALYVDSGCCKEVGPTKLKARFSGWPNLIVRLDIWHFMRRLAVGCTTDAHQLYPTFMARISACIFGWDAADIGELRRAKRAQLAQQGLPAITERELDRHITKDELALHCRRRTRGEETTIHLLDQLLTELMSSKGNDALGVPLLHTVRMQHIWRVQRRHVKCIQDPPGVALYTETGSVTKGGLLLKKYPCARGSTSLESFHCHLNRFIPGNSANTLNYRIYLLEGLNRWNQNRAAAAVSAETSSLRTYTGELVYGVNSNYEKVFGKKLILTFTPPAKYTGELIGVQYLLRQNNECLQDMHPDTEETSQLLEQLDVEEPAEDDEGFEELMGGEGATLANLVVSGDTAEVFFLQTPVSPVQPPSPLSHVQPAPTLPPVQPPSDLSTPQAAPSVSLQPPFPVPPVPSTPASSLQQVAVDQHNIPGMDRVDELAEYLVELRTQTGLTLNNQQASTIVGLWQSLEQFDKDRIVYAARHQDRLVTGRFRSPKKKGVFTPGVESTKRCVLGSSGSPAQWPNCCRLIEAIFVRLCNIHTSPKKWDSRAYPGGLLVYGTTKKSGS